MNYFEKLTRHFSPESKNCENQNSIQGKGKIISSVGKHQDSHARIQSSTDGLRKT